MKLPGKEKIFFRQSTHIYFLQAEYLRFRYTVGFGGGDGAANFAELDSDFSELGKHV